MIPNVEIPMSKLINLFESSSFARLNSIAGGGKNFSVRKQSNTDQSIRQENAVDFFGNTYQDGFDVNKPTMSTTGFAKSVNAQNSDFTGTTNTPTTTNTNNALDTYSRYANDEIRNRYKSKLVHRYLATESAKQYKTQQETSAGIVLGYTPA